MSKSNKMSLKVLVEAKSTTQVGPAGVSAAVQCALRRQDSSAKISFIVVNKTLKDLKNFKLRKFKVLNRSKEGNKFAESNTTLSSARLFRLRIDNKKVVAIPMDNKTSKTATRLIFRISRDDINNDISNIR
jgi:hypothetical protein